MPLIKKLEKKKKKLASIYSDGLAICNKCRGATFHGEQMKFLNRSHTSKLQPIALRLTYVMVPCIERLNLVGLDCISYSVTSALRQVSRRTLFPHRYYILPGRQSALITFCQAALAGAQKLLHIARQLAMAAAACKSYYKLPGSIRCAHNIIRMKIN